MDYTQVDIENITKQLKEILDEKRYQHSIGTAEYAKYLAQQYNLDQDKAYLAGLLHDCAKCIPNEELRQIIDTKLDIPQEEIISYKTYHAPVGAYMAKNKFGINDEEILSSIRWHTVGKVGMTDFEKIIFLADKVELRTRNFSYAEELRKHFDNKGSLDFAMLTCYKKTIISLVERDLKISPVTIDIYNSYEDKVNVN